MQIRFLFVTLGMTPVLLLSVWALPQRLRAQQPDLLRQRTEAQAQLRVLELQRRQLEEQGKEQVQELEEQEREQIEQLKQEASRQAQQVRRQVTRQIERVRQQARRQQELLEAQMQLVEAQAGIRSTLSKETSPKVRTIGQASSAEPRNRLRQPGVSPSVEEKLGKILERLERIEKRLDRLEKGQ